LVDDVDAALATNQLVVTMAAAQRLERVADLHRRAPKRDGWEWSTRKTAVAHGVEKVAAFYSLPLSLSTRKPKDRVRHRARPGPDRGPRRDRRGAPPCVDAAGPGGGPRAMSADAAHRRGRLRYLAGRDAAATLRRQASAREAARRGGLACAGRA